MEVVSQEQKTIKIKPPKF